MISKRVGLAFLSLMKVVRNTAFFDNTLCIVPALSYDKDGYRLGFGMGFYDRFLADYNGMKLGLCYDNCMSESFWHDGYDISVDKVFTDKDIYTINTKERK